MMRDSFTEMERARSALASLDAGCDRATWVRHGMAAKSAGLSFGDFLSWSESAPNFLDVKDCRSTWNSFKSNGGINPGSLFFFANSAGWQDNTKKPRQERTPPRQKEPEQPKSDKAPLFDAQRVWDTCTPATSSHKYVARKLGLPDGLRTYSGPLKIAGQVCDGALVLPCYSLNGMIASLLFIPPGEGARKLLLPGCKLPPDACFIVGGPIRANRPVYIVEGIGQGWSAHQATTAPAVVCFGVGRMAGVAKALRERHQDVALCLVADAGKEKQCADIASYIKGSFVEMPKGSPSNFDLNDHHQAHGLKSVTALLEAAKKPASIFDLENRTADKLFIGEPPPVNWLVKGIFPLGVCCLLASPPNVGKSFLALDLAAKVANRPDPNNWLTPTAFGALIGAHGRAVYVSAEDDQPEIHRRLWSLCAGKMPDRLHVLSLPDVGHFGIIEQFQGAFAPTEKWVALTEEIKTLPDVKLIVLDTLQALTAGDTNTVEATQPLMSEATALAAATKSCVVLIHHVAKGRTQEIRSSLDAMESIRGSGAITGSARAAYVLWPPADGGRAVCNTLGIKFKEGSVAFGLVAKGYGDARRDSSIFVRDASGILQDQTQLFQSCAGQDDNENLRADLLRAIRAAWGAGQSFASTHGPNGLHTRRHELPEGFHEKARAWFEEQTGKLLAEGNIKRLQYRGGFRLVPADANSAVPNAVPEEDSAPEENDVEVTA